VISAWSEDKHGVTVHNAAVGCARGELTLHLPFVNGRLATTRASLLPSTTDCQHIQVPVITLDAINLRPVSFVKIDVEGYELEVLKGASILIDEFHPVLLVEIDRERHDLEEFSTIIDFLRAKGYSCYVARGRDDVAECAQPWGAPGHIYNFIFSTSAF
jgi:FkbM family methyltransferase